MKEIYAILPDFEKREFYRGIIRVAGSRIESIERIHHSAGETEATWPLALPGFVDAHVHIESSMLIPSRFAELAVRHGTVATVSDPHEIANVLGKEGVHFMCRDAETVPLKIHFTAPSCVPATDFESSGARLSAEDIEELFETENLVALGEMMNFPGVIQEVPEVMAKIAVAHKKVLPVDGHAPGLTGNSLKKYVDAGISTDHEAVNLEEAREKLAAGMKILIREGSAAKNFEALHPCITESPNQVMLCSDDLHPDDLAEGHINYLVKRGLELGHSLFDLLKAACTNSIEHYRLNVGQLRPGDPADFILIDSMERMEVQETWINGVPVYEKGQINFSSQNREEPNSFISRAYAADDFVFYGSEGRYRIIEAIDGSLLTPSLQVKLIPNNGIIEADPKNDILKLVVVNRYREAPPAVAWIKNFGLKEGAIGSSVGHDSHNIIVVGCSDAAIARTVNSLISHRGGIALSSEKQDLILPLPVAGIMSNANGRSVGKQYRELSEAARVLGSRLRAPFMTLSFMALLVIPELKLGDRGLFDGLKFEFVTPRIEE